MKTLEQVEDEYRKEFEITHAPLSHRQWKEVAERYANEVSKALLEEVAEKIGEKLDNNNYDHFDAGFNSGIEASKKIVQSLIPKEETK